MFDDLTQKFEHVVKKLRGHGRLTEKSISESMRDVRRAFLEADVNYKVVKQFVGRVQEKAVGQEVTRSIAPGQQVVKIIHDELVVLMGSSEVGLKFSQIPPSTIMLTGLQGSGKTTLAGKLANHLRKRGHIPGLVAADVYRPAAIDQLQVVGKQLGIPVFSDDSGDPVAICGASIEWARKHGIDLLILDTAGRLHIDDEMMSELQKIQDRVRPEEVLFVADGMTGQDAVNTASRFLQKVDFTGVVLTKMDGDARGGAALSIRAVTGRPIKFLGVGEKLDALEAFHPDRMASRILGMGDVVSLVERAQAAVDHETAEKLEKRLRKQVFTLEDFYDQLQQVKNMGPLDQLLGMIPGLSGSALKGLDVDDRALVRVEAIINSMTQTERRSPSIINGSRRQRIARGSGTTVQDVNKLLKQFHMMQKMVRSMGRMGRGKVRGMPFGL